MKNFFMVVAVVTALWGINAGLYAQNDDFHYCPIKVG